MASQTMAPPKSARKLFSSSSVWIPRLTLAALFVSCTVFSPQLQPFLTRFYSYLYHDSSLYRFSAFETLENLVCYAVIEVFFTYKFAHSPDRRLDVRGEASRPGADWRVTASDRSHTSTMDRKENSTRPKLPKMKRPSKRLGEMLISLAPFLLLDFTMIKKYSGVPLEDIVTAGGYEALLPVLHSSIEQQSPYGLSTEMELPSINVQTNDSEKDGHDNSRLPITTDSGISSSFLLPTLHNFTFHSPLQMTRPLPPPTSHPPTPHGLVFQLILSITIYDFLFFLFHLLLHRPPTSLITTIFPFINPSFFTSLHAPHHTHPEMHPQVTNQLSLPERLSLVLLANFSLNVIGAHVLTRTLFVPMFITLLVQIHSGLDLEWGYEKLLPPGWGSGSRVHARHHRHGGEEGLAPFFGWCDAALVRWDHWAGRKRRGGGSAAGAKEVKDA